MTLGVIGTGLIGGSIGMRARDRGVHVIGCDEHSKAAEEAVRVGALNRAVSRAQVLENADVLVIAAHITGTIAELERMREIPPARAQLILDVSSVKTPIVRAARGLRNFVATHPMAGRERSGPAAATADLFEDRTWLYVRSGDGELDARAVEFIASMGALPVEVDARVHDRMVALTSHVPQVFATVFSSRLDAAAGTSMPQKDLSVYLGPVAKELVRLSASSDAMWSDILLANRENVSLELRGIANALLRIADDVESGGANIYEQAIGR